jgi:hypothetical protein
MTQPRSMKEYRDGYRSFVDFAIQNCRTPDRLIVCPCNMCCLNRRHSPGIVLNHLLRERGMLPQYKNWIYHDERPVYASIEGSNSNPQAADAGVSIDQGGNMHAMLHDLYGMHDVREDNCKPQPRVQGDEAHLVDVQLMAPFGRR